MNVLTYKGYTGEYELYNDGEGTATYYAGAIPAVSHKATVLFEGESIDELMEDFHAAVEDCIANGYKPKKQTHRVTISPTLYIQLKARASQSGQSLTNFVNHALASALL